MVVGWVCIDPVNRGQNNYRPAAWHEDKLTVLEDFGCAWGQAVDVNDAGSVLVVGYDLMQRCRAIQWNPTGGWTAVGVKPEVFPVAISADGTVLGTFNDVNGSGIACLAKPGKQWQPLGTAPGFHAIGMNDVGDVIGVVTQDGYHRPRLRLASGEMVSLPYLDHHYCKPLAINNAGVIVGMAQTDHGTHALIWRPLESHVEALMSHCESSSE